MTVEKIVLGTVQFGMNYGINNSEGKPSLESVFEILNEAKKLGIKELDTADAYGESAEVLNQYFGQYGNSFKTMSKFISDSKKSFHEQFEISCNRLGVKKLEGYYFHRFLDFENFKEFDAVVELKKAGRLGKLAVSLYSNEELEIAVKSPHIDLIQLPFNIFDHSARKVELLREATLQGKDIYIRSVFLQGLMFKNPIDLSPKLQSFAGPILEVQRISKKYQVSIEELCLSFVLSKDFIKKVIIGVDRVDQLIRNVEMSSRHLPALAFEELDAIKIADPALLNPGNWN